ncbi:dTDP-4-dehydrorhamnose 3,5-epimerase family protein, partial [Arcticibacter eurypsychrophilus]|uniref:dTDP-4-dehydrorhamnose 3,5-epimerase family protein n=1 Tax=Arcticibacter eurypsychrophilus TaxID=1434752 RepID=UPI00147E18EB
MNIIPTPIEGCFIMEPAVYPDARGYFFESFNEASFNKKTGLDVHFVQDNQSLS